MKIDIKLQLKFNNAVNNYPDYNEKYLLDNHYFLKLTIHKIIYLN